MSIQSVLLIEDDEGFQFYIKTLMEKHYPDVAVTQAYDGAEALAHLDSPDHQMPDLILLDLNMFGLNGFEFLRQWAENHQDKDVRIVIMSSSDQPQDQEQVQNYAFVESYLVKPINEKDIDKLLKC